MSVEVGDEGTDPVHGYFKLGFNTTTEAQGIETCGDFGTPYVCVDEQTVLIRHDIAASRADNADYSMESVLEDLANVGDVAVERFPTDVPFSGGYTWNVTFLRDAEAASQCSEGSLPGVQACPSPGNVPDLSVLLDSASAQPQLAGNNVTATVLEATRGNVLFGEFSFESDVVRAGGNASAVVAFDASTDDLADGLRSVDAYDAVMVSRTRTTKYRTYQWTVTFTANRGMVPAGAGDIDLLSTQFNVSATALPINTPVLLGESGVGACGACQSTSSAGIGAVEVEAGSIGLNGTFDVSMPGAAGHNTGARTFSLDASARRIELQLEELSSVVDVHVSIDRTWGAGWNAEHVQPAARKGGYRVNVYFVRNPGAFDGGIAYPHGAGNPLQL